MYFDKTQVLHGVGSTWTVVQVEHVQSVPTEGPEDQHLSRALSSLPTLVFCPVVAEEVCFSEQPLLCSREVSTEMEAPTEL